jgi:hypothetical protein
MRNERGQFVKGESGNPHGRPLKGQTFTDLIGTVGAEEFDTLTRKERLVRKLWELAEGGDLGALRYLIDRCDGRPRESRLVFYPEAEVETDREREKHIRFIKYLRSLPEDELQRFGEAYGVFDN